MIALPDSYEFQALAFHQRSQIGHVQETDPVASCDKFAPERSKGVYVPRDGRTNDAEVHPSGFHSAPVFLRQWLRHARFRPQSGLM